MKLIDFRKTMDAYFEECASAGIFPDEAGLLLRLKLSRALYEAYLGAKSGPRVRFRRVLEEAALRRESILTRELYATEKSAAGKVFLARQIAAAQASAKTDEGGAKAAFEVTLLGETDFLD